MTSTIITEGQSLVDVALQELGNVEALFDLADANGLAITDLLTPGQVLAVPASTSAVPSLADYFRARQQRINTGAPVPKLILRRRDFNAIDFQLIDFG